MVRIAERIILAVSPFLADKNIPQAALVKSSLAGYTLKRAIVKKFRNYCLKSMANVVNIARIAVNRRLLSAVN